MTSGHPLKVKMSVDILKKIGLRLFRFSIILPLLPSSGNGSKGQIGCLQSSQCIPPPYHNYPEKQTHLPRFVRWLIPDNHQDPKDARR